MSKSTIQNIVSKLIEIEESRIVDQARELVKNPSSKNKDFEWLSSSKQLPSNNLYWHHDWLDIPQDHQEVSLQKHGFEYLDDNVAHMYLSAPSSVSHHEITRYLHSPEGIKHLSKYGFTPVRQQ